MSENLIVSSTSDELEAVIAAADATNEMLAAGTPPEIAENLSPETIEAAVENPEARAEDLQRSQQRPPKSKVQKRFDKITAQNYELRETNERLQRRLQEIERSSASASTSEKPRAEDFKTYDEFVDKLSDWKAAQRVPQIQDPPYVPENARPDEYVPRHEVERLANERAEVRARELRDTEQRGQMHQQHLASVEHARQSYPDFDEATAAAANVQIPAALVNVVPQLPNSGQIVYILSKEPALAAELAHLAKIGRSDLAIAKVSMLSAHLETQAANRGQQAVPVRVPVSHAPKPIKPVGSSPTSSTQDLDQADYQTFKRVRQQQEKMRYRR
jgi:hypothetical protein